MAKPKYTITDHTQTETAPKSCPTDAANVPVRVNAGTGARGGNMHAGHRARLREVYLNGGIDALSEVNRLEMLLFYAIPRKDTNPIAHRLLDTFGSTIGVFSAPVEQLASVEGMTVNAAILLRLSAQVNMAAICQQVEVQFDGILSTTEKCGNYLVPKFFGARNESVYMLCLDAKCKLLACRKVSEGSVNAANVSVRQIVETALHLNATSVVLAHNHTNGLALPSREDEHTTQRLQVALEAVGIQLADHIIVADNDFVSMVQSGFLNPQPGSGGF